MATVLRGRVPRLRCLQPCSASNDRTVAERRNRGTRLDKARKFLGTTLGYL